MNDGQISQEILQLTEALLTATPEPLTQARFNQCLEADDVRLPVAIAQLTQIFEEQERPVEIVAVAGGFQLVTKSEYFPFLKRLFHRIGRLNLTRAALEALSPLLPISSQYPAPRLSKFVALIVITYSKPCSKKNS